MEMLHWGKVKSSVLRSLDPVFRLQYLLGSLSNTVTGNIDG